MGSKCDRKTAEGVSVPVGFRFHPTEEELVNHYLRKKKQDKDFKVNHIIPEIAFCKHEPWDLPGNNPLIYLTLSFLTTHFSLMMHGYLYRAEFEILGALCET